MVTQECWHANVVSVPRLDKVDANDLIQQFEQAWELEETLMGSLVEDSTFYLNPDPLRNPLIFYLGHSAVFYINKLIRVGLLDQRINPEYEVLFEIGVDPSTPEELDAAIQSIEWPKVEAVWRYRDQAREIITTAIRRAPITLPIHQQHPLWAFLMGIEHSRIHFETSSMLIRQYPLSHVQCPANWNYAPATVSGPSLAQDSRDMIYVPGGSVDLGKAQDAVTYGWDIDYGHRRVDVQPFWISPFLVTNQDFLAFVDAGGYANRDYWSVEAWEWVQRYQITHPKFWRSPPSSSYYTTDSKHGTNGTSYRYRAMFDEIDLPLSWPAEVNHHEAMAFCRWKGDGSRLLTEAEWNQALTIHGHRNAIDCYNLDYRWGSPCSVGWVEQASHFDVAETNDVYDLRGNVWEWLRDPFSPLPGFQPHYLYEDYSQPFFDNQHYLMVGGSWASTGSYASDQCRNWFRPYFHQHVGFRTARDVT